MSICVIPARGGSKRIPRKNIRDFCGKPMIQWSIEAAIAADCFDHILVSTDSEEIAELAVDCGVSVPFIRPHSLADDHTATQAVVKHAVEFVEHHWSTLFTTDMPVCCLYATAPFVQSEDIVKGLSLLTADNYVLPVTSFCFPIQRAARISDDGSLSLFEPEHFTSRSQDLEEAWHDAGQFYWACAATWCGDVLPYAKSTLPLILPRWRVQDIDTPEDWTRAEALFNATARSVVHQRAA